MFIHSLSQRSFGLPYVLEATFRTVNEVNQIIEFTSNLIFWWEIFALESSFGGETGDRVQFLNFWTICTLAQSSTNWGENSWFEGFVYGRGSYPCRCEFVP